MVIKVEKIKTGIYKTYVLRSTRELFISRNKLEKKLEELEKTIQSLELKKEEKVPHYTILNLDRIKRLSQTGKMLLDGFSADEITKYFCLKNSTVESYILYFK